MNEKNTESKELGSWIKRIVRDDLNDPYGFFSRRYECSACGRWQTYGETAYCPHCGKPMAIDNAEKGAVENA